MVDTGCTFTFSKIIGRSAAMQEFCRHLQTVTQTEAPTLIEGETGVGKNLVARVLHQQGRRAARPLVALNAANLPGRLFESEFFGHAAGALSSVYGDHQGLARAADGGTLLLDDIGELPPSSQAKLLHLLDHQEVRPVGGLRSTKVDLRLITTTNQDLRPLVQSNAFRKDLYYRLRVITLRVPSLRERREDVPLLVEHFLHKFCRKYGKQAVSVSPEAMDELAAHPWEGNVRELENEIERAVLLAPDGQEISKKLLSLESIPPCLEPSQGMTLQESRRAAERQVILQTLKGCRWNVSAAARELGISRVGLTKKLKRLDMKRPGHGDD